MQLNNRMLQFEIDFYKNEIEEIRKLCNYDLLNKIETKQHEHNANYIKELESILGSPKSLTSKHTISSF